MDGIILEDELARGEDRISVLRALTSVRAGACSTTRRRQP
jgi:hypothetical protein